MEYKITKLDEVKLVGKTFEFPTSEIQTVSYPMFYGEVCHGMDPQISYGIYEIGDEITKFTVAIKTDIENDYDEVMVNAGEFIEFEIDFMENQKENQYVKCFEQLEKDEVEYNMSYSIEIMDRNFNPMKKQYMYKYYVKK